jgi:Regulatory subunit of type II PKA R-subunit
MSFLPEINMDDDQSEEQSLRLLENYIATHNVQLLLKDCIVQLCVSRPNNPIVFLRQYFQKLERVSVFFLVFAIFLFSLGPSLRV